MAWNVADQTVPRESSTIKPILYRATILTQSVVISGLKITVVIDINFYQLPSNLPLCRRYRTPYTG